MPPQDTDRRDPNTYLAEDRTFLAWIRSGIAMMGFGFVVARFGLFLRQLEAMRSGSPLQTTAFSVILGTVLIASGVIVTVVASIQYVARIRSLQRGVPARLGPSKLALAAALVLAAAGLAMAIYVAAESVTTQPPVDGAARRTD